MQLAPIALFTYKKIKPLQATIEALQRNLHASGSELIIFSDAAKTQDDERTVAEVRAYLRSIEGFKDIRIIESKINKGLANSIIEGVTQVINTYGKVIVLEDDLITSMNFLAFMNQCLEQYQKTENVFSVSGYSLPLSQQLRTDIYFTKRGSSWGWATWKDRWERVDWSVSDYDQFRNDPNKIKKFNQMGSDMSSMLERQMQGKMDSWAIRWCYHQFKEQTYTVFPTISKIRNIGFGDEATHTFDYFNRYDTTLDTTRQMQFEMIEPYLDSRVIREFTDMYSLTTRVKYKMLNSIGYLMVKFFKAVHYLRKSSSV